MTTHDTTHDGIGRFVQTGRLSIAALLLAASSCWSGAAHAQSIEDKLRTQLRSTTQELRQLQDAQAQLQADKSAADQQRDKALADLKDAQAALVAAKAKSGGDAVAARALAAEKAGRAQADQQAGKYRAAYDNQQALLRSHDAERLRAQADLKTRDTQLQTCEADNTQLYQVGHDILSAYEHVGLGTVIGSREPFAQRARVRYDEIAQHYGDQLYAGKFDPRGAAASAASAASAAGSDGAAGGAAGIAK